MELLAPHKDFISLYPFIAHYVSFLDTFLAELHKNMYIRAYE